MMPPPTAIATVPARAALAGNPSDAYGGAVLAVPVPALSATVRVTWSERSSIRSGDGADTDPAHGVARLIEAAIRRFLGAGGRGERPVAVEWSTTIPRSVGLAGSSALVIAVLEALADLCGTDVDPIERAAMALAVEADDLHIAAGPQDRVVQSVGAPVLMRFDEPGPHGMGRYEVVAGAALDELYVAWSAAGEVPSTVLHERLRRRWADGGNGGAGGDGGLRAGMADIAATAVAAAAALRADDRVAVDAAIDGSLRRREELVGVDEVTRGLAEAARAVGASANTAGSGGAIVGRCDPDRFPVLAPAIRAAGAELLRVGPPDRT